MKRIHLILFILTMLLASACSPEAPDPAPAAAVHEMGITATAEGWEAADTAPTGWTEIGLTNQSEGMRQAAFLRLDDDKTMDDVFAAIQAGMDGVPAWMTSYGGVSGVMPGESKMVTVNLPVGQYIVVDPVPEADGVPGMAKGYFMPLLVEESDITTAAPAGDMAIEMVDYSFNFDTEAVATGRQLLQVSNSGPQEAHELVVIKLDEGASVGDFLAAMAPDAPAGPPPGQIVAGTAAFDTTTENYLEVEFEAGATYGLICFTPSSEHEGQPHFTQGMVTQFEVSG